MYRTLIVFTLIFIFISAFIKLSEGNKINKVSSNDRYNYIAINNILMWLSNNGDGSHDPITDGNGFYWPGGKQATQSAIFEDGFIWGGKINSQVRVNGSTYRQGLQAGKILDNGEADDSGHPKYRVYKIRKDWQALEPSDLITQEDIDQYEKDYNEWPIEDGAPWKDNNRDGFYTDGTDEPDFIGDEIIWCVSNDLDTSRSKFVYGADPIGIEQQMTVFGYNRIGSLGDVIFKKYILINKGQNIVEDMIFSYWSDPDLGGASDDFVGCDTTLNLIYCYNSTNEDLIYGSPVPAIGYLLLQGPVIPGAAEDMAYFNGRIINGFKNQKMTSAALYENSSDIYRDPALGTLEGSVQMYNYMNSLLGSGMPFYNPHTFNEDKYAVAGDPVAGTGWYEGPSGWPGGPPAGDRRMVMSSGSFNFAPADTQEIIVAIIIAKGDDNIDSITKLKAKAAEVKSFYESDLATSIEEQKLTSAPNIFNLKQNYPNPFNPQTVINYEIRKPGKVTIKVFDISGREVAVLVNEKKSAGNHFVEFNSNGFATGIYLYRISYAGFTDYKKMVLVK